MGLELIAEYLFGVGAGERPGNIDPLTDGSVIYSVTDGDDHSGSVDTGLGNIFKPHDLGWTEALYSYGFHPNHLTVVNRVSPYKNILLSI